MVTAGEFRGLAADRGIELRPHPAGATVVPLVQLDRIVDLAQELDLIVLGMDGLDEDGAVVLPRDDFVADLSGITGMRQERVRVSADAARDIATRWVPGPDLVEVVLDGFDE